MDIVEEMKARVPMKELLESYGIEPERGSNIYRCIFHSPDNKPSANINKRNGCFYCFACQTSADIFNVVQHLENCDFKTAMKFIDNKFGLGLMHTLTRAEKLEIARMQREREKAKQEKEHLRQLENQTLDIIVKEMRQEDTLQQICCSLKGKAPFDTRFDVYISAEKRLWWLNWLYDTICGFKDKQECEFDYIYGTDKTELLRKIEKGEIEI